MMWMEKSESGAVPAAVVSFEEEENSASAITIGDDASAVAVTGGASNNTTHIDSKVRNSLLNLRPATMEYLRNKIEKLEHVIQLSSEEFKDEIYDKEGKKHARFNQAERDKMILLSRWMEENRGDGQEVKFNWGDFNKESFNAFVRKVDVIILDEVLEELKLSRDVKQTLEDNRVYTPASLASKSKYWYEHEIKLNSSDISEIEKFKEWYNYQLDTYLPSDWIMSFHKEASQVRELEWRKVLKAIGLRADAIQALEINDVCDFAALIHTSKKWKISEPSFKKLRSDVSSSDSVEPNINASTSSSTTNTDIWDEWRKMGLKESDARHIINFRHWHKFYVARKKYSNWAADFNSAQYEGFVQRYIDPSKVDEFKKPGWRASRNDSLKLAREKQDYYDILQAAVEDGNLTAQDRNRLRQHYHKRREVMELIQEINQDQGVGDHSFQEKRLGEIFDGDVAFESENQKQDELFIQTSSRFFVTSVLSCALLWCWGITTGMFIYDDILGKRPDAAGTNDEEYSIFVNNITFGLVTAVVVQELGEEHAENSLHNRFQPIYKGYLNRMENKIRFERNRSQAKHELGRAWRILRRIPFQLVLYTTRYYTYFWICTGFLTLVYGIIWELALSSPLYSNGQTWAGVAVTLAYSYFGLKGKNEPKKDEYGANGAIDRTIGGEEAKFTDERGETKVVKTRHGLMKEIDRYEGLREKAEDATEYQDAAEYQKCYEQLEELKQLLPTVEELELELQEAEKEMRAAADRQDYVTAGKFQNDVIKLKEKLEDEKDARATGDVSSS